MKEITIEELNEFMLSMPIFYHNCCMLNEGCGGDSCYECLSDSLKELNKVTHHLIIDFDKNKKYFHNDPGIDVWKYNTYYEYLRKHPFWVEAKFMHCFNNITKNGKLICFYCKQPFYSLKGIVMHHNKYNIKEYFGCFNNEDVCIVHYNCHKKIHGWN